MLSFTFRQGGLTRRRVPFAFRNRLVPALEGLLEPPLDSGHEECGVVCVIRGRPSPEDHDHVEFLGVDWLDSKARNLHVSLARETAVWKFRLGIVKGDGTLRVE